MFPYKPTIFTEHKMSVLKTSNYLQESTVVVDFDLVYNVYFYKLSIKVYNVYFYKLSIKVYIAYFYKLSIKVYIVYFYKLSIKVYNVYFYMLSIKGIVWYLIFRHHESYI